MYNLYVEARLGIETIQIITDKATMQSINLISYNKSRKIYDAKLNFKIIGLRYERYRKY
jgi:hypothetical protein